MCVCVCVCDLLKKQPSFVRFSKQGLGFDPSAVYVIFVVDKVTKGQVSLRNASVFACQHHSTTAAYIFLNFHIHAVLIGKTRCNGCKHSNKAILFRKMETVA